MSARRALAGLSLAVSAGLLAGCATELPQPRPEPAAETPPPALDSERLGNVLSEIDANLAEADEARDSELLGPRVIGPAAETRAAEYQLARATDGDVTPHPIVTDPQVTAVATSEDWPRPSMVVSEIPEGENLPLLLALVQPNPRDPYALWGWATLFPGIEVPPMARPETGSDVVRPDADGLVASPEQVVKRYAATLDSSDSKHADAFTDDPYATGVRDRTDGLAEAVEVAGDASSAAEAGDDGPLALATADGGAIVVGEVRTTLTLTRTEPESGLTAGAPFDALLDDTEVDGSVTAVFDVTMAFHVPAADADDKKIEPIGATEVLVDVTRDDDDAPE